MYNKNIKPALSEYAENQISGIRRTKAKVLNHGFHSFKNEDEGFKVTIEYFNFLGFDITIVDRYNCKVTIPDDTELYCLRNGDRIVPTHTYRIPPFSNNRQQGLYVRVRTYCKLNRREAISKNMLSEAIQGHKGFDYKKKKIKDIINIRTGVALGDSLKFNSVSEQMFFTELVFLIPLEELLPTKTNNEAIYEERTDLLFTTVDILSAPDHPYFTGEIYDLNTEHSMLTEKGSNYFDSYLYIDNEMKENRPLFLRKSNGKIMKIEQKTSRSVNIELNARLNINIANIEHQDGLHIYSKEIIDGKEIFSHRVIPYTNKEELELENIYYTESEAKVSESIRDSLLERQLKEKVAEIKNKELHFKEKEMEMKNKMLKEEMRFKNKLHDYKREVLKAESLYKESERKTSTKIEAVVKGLSVSVSLLGSMIALAKILKT